MSFAGRGEPGEHFPQDRGIVLCQRCVEEFVFRFPDSSRTASSSVCPLEVMPTVR